MIQAVAHSAIIRIGVERNHTVLLLYVYVFNLSTVILKTLKFVWTSPKSPPRRGPQGFRPLDHDKGARGYAGAVWSWSWRDARVCPIPPGFQQAGIGHALRWMRAGGGVTVAEEARFRRSTCCRQVGARFCSSDGCVGGTVAGDSWSAH